MKMHKRIAFLLGCLGFLFLAGCARIHKTGIEEVVTKELDLLKNMDTRTVNTYISADKLFPNEKIQGAVSAEIEEMFTQFFKNFNYKILDVQSDDTKATVTIRLNTIDSHALAKDFAKAHLKQDIKAAADSPDGKTPSDASLESHYLLLNKLMKTKKYEVVETNCTMHLVKVHDNWNIKKDYELQNALVGGFLTYISDPNLLTPTETTEVYFSTIKKMTPEEMDNYLGLSDTLKEGDDDWQEIASALMEQIYKNFDYKILDAKEDGYKATVNTEIITFDSQKILSEYETELNEYLKTPQAVIDGQEGREKTSSDMLLEHIQNNTAVISSQLPMYLVNDSTGWKLKLDESIGQALFGSLISQPAANGAETDEDSMGPDEDGRDDSEDGSIAEEISEEDGELS